jgi:putative endonuclease
VYILRLLNGYYYVGFSTNIKARIKDHERGIVSATRHFRPISLVFYCAFVVRNKALKFERYLKSSSGFAFRNKHLV